MAAIERAYFRAIVEGRIEGRASLANAAGASRSTVTRFFAGRATSIRTTQAILGVLGIRFDDVARPCEPSYG
jgi:hypothetical protein